MNLGQLPAQSISNEEDASLELDLLKDIDLTKYPPHRLHFLVYALQKGTKLPSQSSMKRSQIRNNRKTGVVQANSIMNRRVIPSSLTLLRMFRIPPKFGSQPIRQIPKPRIGRRLIRTVFTRFKRPAHVVAKKPISLPIEKKSKVKGTKISKAKALAFRSRSPYWILSKARRQKFIQQIQNYYKLKSINFDLQINKKNKIPDYFIKKKQNQNRRRRQKHLLIKSNRQALTQIFGNAIFQRGWPVSRKQIKLALGIKEEDHMKPEFLGQFMQMAQSKRQLLPNQKPIQKQKFKFHTEVMEAQVSRMIRKIKISKERAQENSSSEPKKYVCSDLKQRGVIYKPNIDQFPSLF